MTVRPALAPSRGASRIRHRTPLVSRRLCIARFGPRYRGDLRRRGRSGAGRALRRPGRRARPEAPRRPRVGPGVRTLPSSVRSSSRRPTPWSGLPGPPLPHAATDPRHPPLSAAARARGGVGRGPPDAGVRAGAGSRRVPGRPGRSHAGWPISKNRASPPPVRRRGCRAAPPRAGAHPRGDGRRATGLGRVIVIMVGCPSGRCPAPASGRRTCRGCELTGSLDR